jgi:hypothetical protein
MLPLALLNRLGSTRTLRVVASGDLARAQPPVTRPRRLGRPTTSAHDWSAEQADDVIKRSVTFLQQHR